ncbi:MAG TPA: (2Fe-2S)-binding protein [Longimicrobiales bacterium]|nr:(2Fe-2S)-binding protein [Longimicrobiales bacterium]
MRRAIQFTLNGRPAEVEADAQRLLLWVLRTDLGLTGTKYACGERECGACTVLVDGRPVFSCRTRVGSVQGREVTTIEGLAAADGTLHPVQKAFVEHGALQCGFCTPGMIMRAVGFLNRNPAPAAEDVARGMEPNLCRCGTYTRVVDAVQQAARELRAEEERP